MAHDTKFMEKLTSLCKRRGFIFQSSEIYGGIGGFWDYGPLGVELKRNVKNLWWHDMVTCPPIGPDGKEIKMVGLDCSIIMNPKVWEASGHVGGFNDPMCDCKECKGRFRADQAFQVILRREPGGDVFATTAVEADSVEDAVIKAEPKAKKLSKKHGGGDYHAEAIAFEQAASGAALATLECPACGAVGTCTEPRAFNMMFQTYVGALQDASSVAYLRPETAQGIFANYANVLDTQRVKLPFGIAQVGKSFRNEINPRNYTFRSREFEQMEIEFFCHEEDAMDWYEFWRNTRYNWYTNLGLKSEKLRLRDQEEAELAHYSKACADIEYLFPFSEDFQELEGCAHRGQYDLGKHQKHSGKDLTYFDDDAWERNKDQYAGEEKKKIKEIKNQMPYRFLPTVIEPSAGADRAALAFLCEAYTEDEAPDDKGNMQVRTVMKFHPKLAPMKAAVFPLVNKEGMPDIAEKIYRDIKKDMPAFFDVKGAIGRRYRRQDEIGTPYCITVDGDTLSEGTVTIRDRDSLQQYRVSKDNIVQWVKDHIEGNQ